MHSALKVRFCHRCRELRPGTSFVDRTNGKVRTSCRVCRDEAAKDAKRRIKAEKILFPIYRSQALALEQGKMYSLAICKKSARFWGAYYKLGQDLNKVNTQIEDLLKGTEFEWMAKPPEAPAPEAETDTRTPVSEETTDVTDPNA